MNRLIVYAKNVRKTTSYILLLCVVLTCSNILSDSSASDTQNNPRSAPSYQIFCDYDAILKVKD